MMISFPPQFQLLIVNSAINLIAAIVILVVGWMIAAWASRAVRVGLRRIPNFDSTFRPLLASLVRYAIVILTVIAVLQRFGVETTSLIAVLGAAGLAIGLALQGTLSNVAAGVMLIFLRPFRRGEKVEIDKNKGTVSELGLFRTILMTDDGIFVSIPNAAIFSTTIINYHRETLRRTNFIIPVSRSADIDKTREVILAVLTDHPGVLKNPAPAVPLNSITENAMNVAVQAWTNASGFGDANDDLIYKVQRALAAAGVPVPTVLAIPR